MKKFFNSYFFFYYFYFVKISRLLLSKITCKKKK